MRQPRSLHSHQTMADAKVWRSKKENSSAAKAADSPQRRWKIEDDSAARNHQEKMKLRRPHDTEPDEEVDVVGRAEVAAPRRAAVEGVVAPAAAAQQTGRTSRGSCGVGHAS